MTAYESLKAFQTEVGSRRAGTPGEQKAQQWLKARAERLGLKVELDPFLFIQSPTYHQLSLLLLILWFFASGWLLFNGYMIGILGFILGYIYLGGAQRWLEMRFARSRSQNILAGVSRSVSEYVADPDKGAAIFVCAHYDTPRNFNWFQTASRKLYPITVPLMVLSAIPVTLYAIIAGEVYLINRLGDPNYLIWFKYVTPWFSWITLAMMAPFLVTVLLGFFIQLLSKKTDSPGADDNGSGCALTLELARRFTVHPTRAAQIFFAWWGAEEAGLFGSSQFIRRFAPQMDPAQVYLVNADCVGVGDSLTVHVGQGIFRRKWTEPHAVVRIQKLAKIFGIPTVRTWETIFTGGSSDHAEWIRRGFNQTVSLCRENPQPTSLLTKVLCWLLRIPHAHTMDLPHIHTPADTLEGIRHDVLEKTTDLAEAYIHEIDKELLEKRKLISER